MRELGAPPRKRDDQVGSTTDKTTRGNRPAPATTQQAKTTIDRLTVAPNLADPIGIEPTKLDIGSQSNGGFGAPIRPKLLAAMGAGALLGVAFLILTLLGLQVLAWSLLVVAMTSALVDIVLIAAGFPGLFSLGPIRGRLR